MKRIRMLMYSIFKKIILSTFFMSLFIESAHATTNYYSLTGDKDFVMNILDKYFNPDQVNVIGTVLSVYMPICLSVSGIIAAYILIVGTVSTAHDGEVLGKKWSSMWVPIRAPLAVSLLLPYSNGWAVIQCIVLSLAVQGSEWGNDVWKKTAPSLITDNTYISITNKTAIRQLIVNTLYSAACVQIANDDVTKNVKDSSLFGFTQSVRYMDIVKFKSESGSNNMVGYTYGYPDGNSFLGYKSDICGSTKMKLLNEDNMPDAASLLINTNSISLNVQKAQLAANEVLVRAANVYAASYLKNPKPSDVASVNKTIDLMTNLYAQTIQTAANAAMKEAVNQSQIDKLTEAGWTYSYAFYMRITTANSSANAALNNFPIASAALSESDFSQL